MCNIEYIRHELWPGLLKRCYCTKAAIMLSDANTNEVYLHWGSKFINGALDFFSGRFGSSIASALEIYNIFTDDGISNKEQRYSDDAKEGANKFLI